jgi:hypothetical protein
MSSTSSRRADGEPTKYFVTRGTATFAAVLLITVSALEILEGIAAIAEDTVFVTGLNYAFEFDLTTWGWIHLALGIIGVGVGLGILAGQAWGLLLGVLIAFFGALSNFAFLPYYPFWGIVLLAFNGFVIWALCSEIVRD